MHCRMEEGRAERANWFLVLFVASLVSLVRTSFFCHFNYLTPLPFLALAAAAAVE